MKNPVYRESKIQGFETFRYVELIASSLSWEQMNWMAVMSIVNKYVE